MTFAEAVQSVFSKSTKVEGRAPRSEFWYWILFVIIVQLVTIVPVIMVAMLIQAQDVWALLPFLIAAGAISLFLWLGTITVSIRRLHDQGLSGWFFLLFLIPSLGGLIQFIFMLQPSNPGSNKFGPQSLT